MAFSNSGHQRSPRHAASSFDLRGSYRSSGHGLDNQRYNDPFAIPHNNLGLPHPLPPLQPLTSPNRRLRKHSSSASLRGGLGGGALYPTTTNLHGSLAYDSGWPSNPTSNLPPLPPLSSILSLPPLGSFPNPPPPGSYSNLPPLSNSRFSPLSSTHPRRSDTGRGHGYHNSLGSYNSSLDYASILEDQSEWDGLTTVAVAKTVGSTIAMSPGQNTPTGRRIRRMGSTMDLNSGRTSSIELGAFQSAMSSTSLLPSPMRMQMQMQGSLDTSHHTTGMLPMPPLRSSSSRSGSGHIVLSTDYRVLRLSRNVLVWLEYSSASITGISSGLNALTGRPIASVVAASDQLLFGDYLAELHAERRKAEKTRLSALSGGGEGLARGVSTTVNFATGDGGVKPFMLTIWPVTRRIQGYEQAVLTGELIPAFADALPPMSSVTPL